MTRSELVKVILAALHNKGYRKGKTPFDCAVEYVTGLPDKEFCNLLRPLIPTDAKMTIDGPTPEDLIKRIHSMTDDK